MRLSRSRNEILGKCEDYTLNRAKNRSNYWKINGFLRKINQITPILGSKSRKQSNLNISFILFTLNLYLYHKQALKLLKFYLEENYIEGNFNF